MVFQWFCFLVNHCCLWFSTCQPLVLMVFQWFFTCQPLVSMVFQWFLDVEPLVSMFFFNGVNKRHCYSNYSLLDPSQQRISQIGRDLPLNEEFGNHQWFWSDNHCYQWFLVWQTIDTNGFSMVFGLVPIVFQWFCSPATIGHYGFSTVSNGR